VQLPSGASIARGCCEQQKQKLQGYGGACLAAAAAQSAHLGADDPNSSGGLGCE
jgi:hypothetical protein